MSSNIENIVENLNTIQDISEMINDPRLTRGAREVVEVVEATTKNIKYSQSGGFIGPILVAIKDIVVGAVWFVIKLLKDLALQLFYWKPWKQGDRALFWKYIIFCIKCGFYLLIFAIAGPIFIVIGIAMVYSKMLGKMGTDGSTLIRERLSAARDL